MLAAGRVAMHLFLFNADVSGLLQSSAGDQSGAATQVRKGFPLGASGVQITQDGRLARSPLDYLIEGFVIRPVLKHHHLAGLLLMAFLTHRFGHNAAYHLLHRHGIIPRGPLGQIHQRR